jgi:cellulose synthase operon protein YhjU
MRLVKTTGDLAAFTPSYLLELVLRFINPWVVLQLALLLIVWLLLAHRLRMASFAFIGILSAPLVLWMQHLQTVQPIQTADAGAGAPQVLTQEALTTRLNTFFAAEAPRRVSFPKTLQGPEFDIVLMHTCSLAWDDVELVNQRNDRLFGRFDVLFTRFNSASSYSGPAAIRVLRSACGQQPHEDLYGPLDPQCALINQLAQVGYQPQWTMTHDGEFGNFSSVMERNMGLPVKFELDTGARIAQRAFDGSAIYADYDVLSRWWQRRQTLPAARTVLFYNTSTLHDGNRIEGAGRLDAKESYDRRLKDFLGDANQFLDLLEKSGRRAVVVMVPEHGAALRGDRVQISGLREVPTPAITQVPVGIKLVGPGWTDGPQQVVETPTGHLAVAELISRFLSSNPFAGGATTLPDLVRGLPQTEAVSENEGTVVMQVGSGHQLRSPDGSWTPFDERPR